MKYLFVAMIEACVDVAQHIDAAEGWGPPSDNGAALLLLGDHSVINTTLARSMRRAVGFRNVLVHEYVEVDDAVVQQRLNDLSDIDDFVSAVATWISRQT